MTPRNKSPNSQQAQPKTKHNPVALHKMTRDKVTGATGLGQSFPSPENLPHSLKDDTRKSRVGPNSQRKGEIEDSVLGASPRLYRAPLFRVVRVGNRPQFFVHRLLVS